MQDLETLENPFSEDWRDCLRAHYIHVVREQDTNNENSLVTVLRDTGFSEQEVLHLRADILESIGIEPELVAPPVIEEPEPEVIEVVEAVEIAQEIAGVVTVIEDTPAEVLAEITAEVVEPIQGSLFVETPEPEQPNTPEPPKQMSLF